MPLNDTPGGGLTADMAWRESVLRPELFRHCETIQRLSAKLEDAEYYPTETPPKLCQLIGKTARQMSKTLADVPTVNLPYVHELLDRFGKHLRYVERSRITETPWSMVQAVEMFLKEQVGKECHFIIRPQWSYNYCILGDFVSFYRTYVQSMQPWLNEKEWEKDLGQLAHEHIYCISFPRTERLNVLMHVSWGHEVGHILASRWIHERFQDFWLRHQDDLTGRLRTERLKEKVPEDAFLKEFYLNEKVAEDLKLIMELTQSGLKELLCDAVGVHLFGPALLVSLSEYCSRFVLDANPIGRGYYPPWRYRLRMAGDALHAEDKGPDLWGCTFAQDQRLKPYCDRLKQTMEITVNNADNFEIKRNLHTREAYGLIESDWKRLRLEVLGQLPDASRAPYELRNRHQKVSELVQKLATGVPANETGIWPDTVTSSLGDIWNAAWACKFYRHQRGELITLDDYETLYRLTLKGMEAGFVQSTYGPRLKKLETE